MYTLALFIQDFTIEHPVNKVNWTSGKSFLINRVPISFHTKTVQKKTEKQRSSFKMDQCLKLLRLFSILKVSFVLFTDDLKDGAYKLLKAKNCKVKWKIKLLIVNVANFNLKLKLGWDWKEKSISKICRRWIVEASTVPWATKARKNYYFCSSWWCFWSECRRLYKDGIAFAILGNVKLWNRADVLDSEL